VRCIVLQRLKTNRWYIRNSAFLAIIITAEMDRSHLRRRMFALPTHTENAYYSPSFAGHLGMPMPKISAVRKAARGILFAALVAISLSSMAQQPAGQQSAVPTSKGSTVDGATAAAIAAEGALKATIRTFQAAVYRYYWWHDSCYVRYQSGDCEPVPSDYCH
jgi:hypothetical protein